MPSPNDNSESTASDNQERCLPANCFSVNGEEHFEPDKPWKKKRSLFRRSHNEESKDSSTHKKVRRSRTVPWLSRDSTASLSQGSTSEFLPKVTKLKNLMTTIMRKTP